MSELSAQFVGQQDFWANSKHRPDKAGDFLNRTEVIRMLAADGLPGVKILDAGCGTGYVAEMLGRRGAHVWGIDECIPFIDAATNSTANDVARFQCGKIEKLPYGSECFDRVIAVSVLQYMYKGYIGEFFRHVARVLRKNGTMVVSMTHPDLYRLCYRDHEGDTQDKPAWIHFSGRSGSDGVDMVDTYTQHYFDASGNVSVLQGVRAYSGKDIADMAECAGLTMVSSRSIEYPKSLVEKYPQWGSAWGYPAYLILEFRK